MLLTGRHPPGYIVGEDHIMTKKMQSNETDLELAQDLRKARETLGLSRAKLATVIKVSAGLIQLWEEGKLPVKDAYVPRLIEALGLPLRLRVSDDTRDRLAVIEKPATRMIVLAGEIQKDAVVTIRNRQVIEAFDALLAFKVETNDLEWMHLFQGELALCRRVHLMDAKDGAATIFVLQDGKAYCGNLGKMPDSYTPAGFKAGQKGAIQCLGTPARVFETGKVKLLLRLAGSIKKWATAGLDELLSVPVADTTSKSQGKRKREETGK